MANTISKVENFANYFQEIAMNTKRTELLEVNVSDESLMEIFLNSDPSFAFVAIVVIIVSALSVLILLFDFYTPIPDGPRRKSQFFVLFEFNIRKIFLAQTPDTLSTLCCGVKTILGNQCERPCVFVFLATSESHCTALALAKKLAQTIIVSFNNELSVEKVHKVVMKGSKYTSFENYWDFHRGLSKRMETTKVAIVTEFQTIHPHVATVLTTLADDAFSPFPQSVIILLLSIENFFSGRDLIRKTPVSLAETYLEHIMSAFLDSSTMKELQRCTCGRAVLINREKVIEKPIVKNGLKNKC